MIHNRRVLLDDGDSRVLIVERPEAVSVRCPATDMVFLSIRKDYCSFFQMANDYMRRGFKPVEYCGAVS